MVPSGEGEQGINVLTCSFLKPVRILLLISGVWWGMTESWTEQDWSVTESNSHFVDESQGTVSKTEIGEYLPSLQKRQSLNHMYKRMTHVSVNRVKHWLIWSPCQQCTHLNSSLYQCSHLYSCASPCLRWTLWDWSCQHWGPSDKWLMWQSRRAL